MFFIVLLTRAVGRRCRILLEWRQVRCPGFSWARFGESYTAYGVTFSYIGANHENNNSVPGSCFGFGIDTGRCCSNASYSPSSRCCPFRWIPWRRILWRQVPWRILGRILGWSMVAVVGPLWRSDILRCLCAVLLRVSVLLWISVLCVPARAPLWKCCALTTTCDPVLRRNG
jgi:hypothetical protein